MSPDLYRKRLHRVLASLRSPARIFDARLLSYDTGSIISMLLSDNNLDQPDWGQEKPAVAGDMTIEEVPGLGEEFSKSFGALDKKVEERLSCGEKLNISGKVLNLNDPSNMRSSGNYLYHPNFIGVGIDGQNPEFFTGTYLTKMVSRTNTIEEVWRAAPAKSGSGNPEK